MSKELEALDSIMVSLAEYKEYAIDKLPNKAKEIREENDDDFLIIETALKEYEGAKKHIEALNKERIENSIKIKALEIIKENLNIDEILLAVKGVCKASDYDLIKEVLL